MFGGEWHGRCGRNLWALRWSLLHPNAEDENISAQRRQSRSNELVSKMVDGKFGRDQSINRSEAAQVTGGSSGALDSVVSTVNRRSVLLSSGAPLERDLHNLDQMIGEGGEACNVLDRATLFRESSAIDAAHSWVDFAIEACHPRSAVVNFS